MHEQLETLLGSYEAGHLDRRQLIGALAAVALGQVVRPTTQRSRRQLRSATE